MTSLKQRLIWILLGPTIFVWLASATATFFSAGEALQDQVDRQLQQYLHLVTYISRVFARQIDEGLPLYESWSGNSLEQLRARPMVVEGAGGHGMEPAVNIWLNGELIAMLAGSPQFETPVSDGFTYFEVKQDSSNWRVLTHYDEVSGLWISVAVEYGAARRTLLRTLTRELLPLLFVLPLTIAVLYLGVSRGLLPLEKLERQLSRRKPGQLEPLLAQNVPAEVAGVVAAINKLIRRLEFALEGERRFTANAAHELLTPLAAIKTEVQLCQRQLRGEPGNEMLARIAQRVDRASHTVEQLLTLARVDPQAPLPLASVGLRALLVEVLAETAHLAAGRGLSVALEDGDELFVRGNAQTLAILLRNLLENAFRYALDSSVVRIELVEKDGVCLQICNECRALPPDEYPRIVERFYRVPGSAATGAGLGLSIVSGIVDQHRASFAVGPGPDGTGFCARVIFRKA